MNTHYWPDRRCWIEHDRRWAYTLNRAASYRAFLCACSVASYLGDGILWYAVILALPWLAGDAGWRCSKHMLIAGLISLLIYKLLKRRVCRPRPYQSCPEIRLHGRALDPFSFPSGHMFHAAGFSLVLAYHFPLGAALLVPIVLIIALSRVVLGLHYPSDVLAGAGFGVLVGLLCVWLI